jgi:hypothetical protein
MEYSRTMAAPEALSLRLLNCRIVIRFITTTTVITAASPQPQRQSQGRLFGLLHPFPQPCSQEGIGFRPLYPVKALEDLFYGPVVTHLFY